MRRTPIMKSECNLKNDLLCFKHDETLRKQRNIIYCLDVQITLFINDMNRNINVKKEEARV